MRARFFDKWIGLRPGDRHQAPGTRLACRQLGRDQEGQPATQGGMLLWQKHGTGPGDGSRAKVKNAEQSQSGRLGKIGKMGKQAL